MKKNVYRVLVKLNSIVVTTLTPFNCDFKRKGKHEKNRMNFPSSHKPSCTVYLLFERMLVWAYKYMTNTDIYHPYIHALSHMLYGEKGKNCTQRDNRKDF